MVEVQITRRFNGFRLDVAFVADVDVVALIGPSGSGKTQTLRAVAGAMRPDTGRIALDGHALFDSARGIDVPPQQRRVGYVPQDYALFPHLDVVGNVAFGLRGRRSAGDRERLAAMLQLVGLQGLEQRRPRELSSGQQQRVALARALIVEPRILLLDEPFAALDAPLRAALRAELAGLQRKLGFHALIVTHDPEDLALAQQVLTLQDGRVITMQ